MEYQEFVEQIKQKVTEQAEEGSKVSVSRILKNNLEPVETVVPISARLIANKSALKFKTEQIEAIRKGLMKGLAEQND